MFAHFQNIQHFLLQELQTAQNHIHVAVAWFTDKDLYRILLQKANNGVEIIVFLTDDHINTSLDFGALVKAGAKVYFTDENKLMHHKFCIIDDKILCFGSYNWTFKANHYNTENLVITQEEELLVSFKQEFKRLYKIYNINPNIDVKEITLYYAQNTLWLKAQIKMLEMQNAFLTTEIDRATQLITRFNLLLKQYIGFAWLKLQEMKMLFAEKKARLTQKEEDVKHFFEQKKQFEQSTQEFKKENQNQKETENQQENPQNTENNPKTETAKKLYYKIVKLCHPDAVEQQYEQEAKVIFNLAKQAFDANDTQKLQEILQDLEQGTAFTLDVENTQELPKLQALFEKLNKNNKIITQELQKLQDSTEYKTLTMYENRWNDYFEETLQKIYKEMSFFNL